MVLRILILLSFFILLSCKEGSQKVLVVGDSWAFYMCYYKSLDQAFKNQGLQDVSTNSTCLATTKTGARAEEWLSLSAHKNTLTALKDKSVKIIYLSLGGNDILSNWKSGYSPAQEKAVFEQIQLNLKKIVSEYKAIRPEIKIIISGYDFPRFIPQHPIKEYKELYEKMGSPSPTELNSLLIRFSSSINQFSKQENIFSQHHLGLMHYYFGNSVGGLLPKKTLSPEFISSASEPDRFGGNFYLQTDPAGLFRIKVGPYDYVDAFHLNHFGYDRIGDHIVFHYLKPWLTN
jgi:lysophospholipase L1-like esterase